MLAVKNKLYQQINLVVRGRQVRVPAKTEVRVNVNEASEQIKELTRRGWIQYRKVR